MHITQEDRIPYLLNERISIADKYSITKASGVQSDLNFKGPGAPQELYKSW